MNTTVETKLNDIHIIIDNLEDLCLGIGRDNDSTKDILMEIFINILDLNALGIDIIDSDNTLDAQIQKQIWIDKTISAIKETAAYQDIKGLN